MQINKTPFACRGALHPGTFYPWNKAEGKFHPRNIQLGELYGSVPPVEAFIRGSTTFHPARFNSRGTFHPFNRGAFHVGTFHQARFHQGNIPPETLHLFFFFFTEGEHSMVEYSTWEHSVRGTFHRGTFHCEHSTFFTEAHSMQEHSIGEPQHRETFQPGIFNLGHGKPVDIPRGTLHPFARGTFHRGIFNSGEKHLGNMPSGTLHPFHMEIFHIPLNKTKQKHHQRQKQQQTNNYVLVIYTNLLSK